MNAGCGWVVFSRQATGNYLWAAVAVHQRTVTVTNFTTNRFQKVFLFAIVATIEGASIQPTCLSDLPLTTLPTVIPRDGIASLLVNRIHSRN
jgi:hypothetical protein